MSTMGGCLKNLNCLKSLERDWVYDQTDAEKQNKVLELLESVRQWTLNSSAALGRSGSDEDGATKGKRKRQQQQLQRSKSAIGHFPNASGSRHGHGHRSSHHHYRHHSPSPSTATAAPPPSYNKGRLNNNLVEAKNRQNHNAAVYYPAKEERKRLQQGTKPSSPLPALSRAQSGPLRSELASPPRATFGSPVYPTRYRLKCQMIESSTGSLKRSTTTFVDSADDYAARRAAASKTSSSSSSTKLAASTATSPSNLYDLRPYPKASSRDKVRAPTAAAFLNHSYPNMSRSERPPVSGPPAPAPRNPLAREPIDLKTVAAVSQRTDKFYRLSDTILQRQNQLLGARPAGDAKRSTAAAARPPQVDLPMTKPVLLRGQRLQQQQPPRPSFDRGLMGFSDEAQWMRKRGGDAAAPLTTSTPNEIRARPTFGYDQFASVAEAGLDGSYVSVATESINSSVIEESLENGPYETADEGIPEYDVEELERQEEEENSNLTESQWKTGDDDDPWGKGGDQPTEPSEDFDTVVAAESYNQPEEEEQGVSESMHSVVESEPPPAAVSVDDADADAGDEMFDTAHEEDEEEEKVENTLVQGWGDENDAEDAAAVEGDAWGEDTNGDATAADENDGWGDDAAFQSAQEVAEPDLAPTDDDDNDGGWDNDEDADAVGTAAQPTDTDQAPDEVEVLRGGHAVVDLEDLYVDDELTPSNPNMMLLRRDSDESKTGGGGDGGGDSDEDVLGEMTAFAARPMLPYQALLLWDLLPRGYESILSMDIPSTGPTSLRSNCTDPDDTTAEEDMADEAECDIGGEDAAKKKASFAQLTSNEDVSQAKRILVVDRA